MRQLERHGNPSLQLVDLPASSGNLDYDVEGCSALEEEEIREKTVR